MKKTSKIKKEMEHQADKATRWIGSTKSIIVHSALFLIAFLLPVFGADFEKVLLTITTIVSLEAIYLAIFIQMSVNKNTHDLVEIQEDVEEIQENIDEIQEDVDEIQEEQEKDSKEDRKLQKKLDLLNGMQDALKKLSEDIEKMKKK